MTTKQINLLPPQDQSELRLLATSRSVSIFGFWIFVSLLVTGLLLWFQYATLQIKFNEATTALSQKLAVLRQIKNQDVEKRFAAVNINLANLMVLEKDHLDLTPALMELAKLMPADIALENLGFLREEKKFEISGRAGSRDSVLRLRENLLASAYFVNVNFPLANLEKARDGKWSYRFYLKPPP